MMKSLSSRYWKYFSVLIALSAYLPVPGSGVLEDWLDDGKLHVHSRLRFEHADSSPLAASDALTLNLRLGYETAAHNGFSGLVDFEMVRLLTDEDDANLAGQHSTSVPRTNIPDPEATELNRLWLRWQDDNLALKIGRQRVIFDNARFVGNVGWRQNEQTYDALRFSAATAEEMGLDFDYLYVDRVHRIFGDDPVTRDFDSESHLMHLNWKISPEVKLTGFAYLQRLESTTGLAFGGSNDTYGISITGSVPTEGETSFSYAATYAAQSENHANPDGQSFSLDYFALSVKAAQGPGFISLGWERLEGDGSRMFTTPLATVHAFQGWADVFLGASVGGALASGVDDVYLDVGYKVPVGNGLSLRALHHWFSAQSAGGDYGTEIDLLAVYPLADNWSVLAKYADFSADGPGFSDVDKFWLQVTYKY